MTPAESTQSVRIACVRFLNTAPLVEGLDKLPGLTLVPTVPSRIAEMVRQGEAEIGMASIVDAGPGLTLLPVGMIGSDGPTMTVRLYSRVAWERVTRLHADTDSHTSVALARIVLNQRFRVTPEVVGFVARERVDRGPSEARPRDGLHDWPETVLLIGDKVVTDHPPKDAYPHELDLGAEWKALTGLPFVYAMWMCRAEEASTDRIRHAAGVLDRQLRHNLGRMGWIARTHAPRARWPEALALEYLCDRLRYRVGENEREAVERFLHEARAIGAAPSASASWMDSEVGAGASGMPA